MRWSQVSRLGNPLVNEVVIPTALKDLWNHWTPSRDKYFQRYYHAPILAKVMNQLYHLGVPEKNRKDLVLGPAHGRQRPEAQLHGPDARGHAAREPLGSRHAAR